MKYKSLTSLEQEIYDSLLDFLRIEEEDFEARYLAGKLDEIIEGKIEIARTLISLQFEEQKILEITGLTKI